MYSKRATRYRGQDAAGRKRAHRWVAQAPAAGASFCRPSCSLQPPLQAGLGLQLQQVRPQCHQQEVEARPSVLAAGGIRGAGGWRLAGGWQEEQG